jgi:hypothetical protein
MKFRTPIFIQAGLGKNAQPIEELCARWDLYGKTLKVLTEGELQKIIVFLPLSSGSRDLPNFQNLELHFIQDSLFGRLLLLFKLKKQINALQPGLVTLIAGDLYVSPLVARILKLPGGAPLRRQSRPPGTWRWCASENEQSSTCTCGLLRCSCL